MKIQVVLFFNILMTNICTNTTNARKQVIVYPVVFVTRTTIVQKRYGWPERTEQHIFIRCPERHITNFVLPVNKKFKGIHIESCGVPNTPFAEQLQKSHVDVAELNELEFNDTYMNMPYPTNYTAGLTIAALKMWNPTNFQAYPEFFTSIKTLKELTFGNMEVPTLPPSESFHLETLILKNSSVKNWDNCDHLQQLDMEGLSKEQIPKEWPSTCSQLKTLRLESLTLEAVQHLMDSMNESTLVNLEELSMQKCSLIKLPLQFMLSKRIQHIDLSDNNLDNEAIFQFPTLKDLKVLALSNNLYVYQVALIDLLHKVPSLQELKLDGVGIDKFLVDEFRDELTKHTSLEVLSMGGKISKNAFQHKHFKSLKVLKMIDEHPLEYTRHLWLYGFPSTGAQQLEVNLGNIRVQYVSIGPKFLETFESVNETQSSNFWLTNKGYKLTVTLGSVDCDCKNDILWRALREFPHFLAMPDLKCSHGGLFRDEPLVNLNCRRATVNGCLRKMSKEVDYTTVVDCNNNAERFRWPRPRGLRKFSAAGNRITSLDKAYLPDTLEWLDLRNNSISRLSEEQSAQLFGNKGRRVLLAGNPIICDCDNQPLLDALHVNQSLVMDYDILTCADSGRPLRLVSVDELCRPRSIMVQVAVSLLAMLVLVAALLVRHYWITLRMILYAHGCCLSCLREEDLDQDRPFDAFLSFAHGDDQYVMEHLLPKLEGEPNFYRICIHYRDWRVGNWIPGQIMQSVRLSKRTIIVLSKNFVKSSWGMLEFRHANAGATSDGRQRLLILVLDDVLSEKLSPEMQGYLELNTYLKCNDPWFWEKLCYAMPHKNQKESPPRRHYNYAATQEYMARMNPGFDGEAFSIQVEEPADSTIHESIMPVVELSDNTAHERSLSVVDPTDSREEENIMPIEGPIYSSEHAKRLPLEIEQTNSTVYENIMPVVDVNDTGILHFYIEQECQLK